MGTRRERVVLELDDQFSGQLARAAAAAEVFQRSLGKTRMESDRTSTALTKADRDTQKFSATVTRSTRDLDSYSGRLGLLASSLGALGPAAVPITAVAIPAVTGLAQQLGLAAMAGGTAVLAFQGVGDALDAMNKAHLDPTAANLEKARQAMARLSPQAQALVRQLESMRDEFKGLKDAAGSGILPGATAALEELETRLPQVERILRRISGATGDALREGAASLAGPEWDNFFDFIQREARPELTKLAKTVGTLAHAFAELWVAFGPINSSFSSWLLDAARSFDAWATGLSATEGFADFMNYLRETGPQVGEAVTAIANAVLQIVEAAAPVGGPVLEALTAVANIIADIADSDFGTPIFGLIAAFSALSLATKAWAGVAGSSVAQFVAGQQKARMAVLATVTAQERASLSVTQMAARQAAGRRQMAMMGSQALLLGASMTGLSDKVGLTNTTTLALMGSLAGPWGMAIGGAIGLTKDFTAANNDLADSITRATGVANDPNAGIQDMLAARRELVAQFGKMANDDSGPFGFGGKWNRMSSFLQGDVGETTDAISDLDRKIADSRDLNRQYKAALGLTDRGFQLATKSGQDFMNAVSELNGVLSRHASMRDYRQSLRDLRQSIKDNGRELNTHTAKADANQAALEGVVTNILKVAAGMKNPTLKADFLKHARDELIKTAAPLEGGRAAVKRLTDSIDDLDASKAEPKIEVNTRDAFADLSYFERELAGLTGKARTVYINEVHRSIFGPTTAPVGGVHVGVTAPQYIDPNGPHKADGGIITGPGGPREDRIPAWLSNGEFVVNAAATAANRGLLEQINAQRFADGGYASSEMWRYQSRQSAGRYGSHMTVNMGDLRVVGTLQTPWGPAQVEGIARAAARDVVADQTALDNTHAGMYRGEGVRG